MIKNFKKKIEMENVKLCFGDKMTKSQFNYIVSLRKKQIGKVRMNYEEMKRYLTKKDATKLIDLLTFEYYDIDVHLTGKEFADVKPKRKPKPKLPKPNNAQLIATTIDMLETKLFVLNKNKKK